MTDDVDAVLFDLDDTLCVYQRSPDEVLSAAFETLDVAPFFDGADYVARFDEFLHAGDDIHAIREACFASFAEDEGHDPTVGHDLAAAYAAERDQAAVEFIPGAERALDALADTYRLGMVTNGDPGMQSQKLDGLGLADRFEVVVHAGVDAPYKPDPEPFHLALEALDATPERAVHVGNSLGSDVAGAHAAGLQSVWLATDETDPDPEPHYVAESMHDVAAEPWA